MTRSKLSSKVLLLVAGIGLSVAAFAGQPAAAQEYCPDGLVPDPSYGCTDYGYPTSPTAICPMVDIMSRTAATTASPMAWVAASTMV